MIYLRYAYEKSGFSKASSIGLQIDDIESIQADVVDEFRAAFPWAKLEKVGSMDSVFDLCVHAFRKTRSRWQQIKWGFKNRPRARLALGFFCISERTLIVVPSNHFYSWAIGDLLRMALVSICSFYFRVQTTIRNQQ